MKLTPLAILLVAIAGCGTDKAPDRTGTCTVTPVPTVTEFFEMAKFKGYGFRFSGAPLALSLDVYIQTISEAEWKDPEKRKKIVRSKPDKKDQVVAWRSAAEDVIKSYESGQMTDEDARDLFSGREGKIVFLIPQEWYSDSRGGYVKLVGQGQAAAFQSIQFSLTEKFRDLDKRFVGGNQGDIPPLKEPVTISPGRTTSLFFMVENVHFGDGKGPTYRLVCRLTAQCLRPPKASQNAAGD
jgi:hypothetical protein